MQEKLLSNQQKLNDINYNYRKIEENIANAAIKSGRTRDDIIFLAATKTVDVEYINYAVGLGLKYIGENKVQELLSKYEGYALDKCSLQFIGHLQSNKVRQIVGKVDMIQSVDSIKLADEISKQSLKHGITTDILLEVNMAGEVSKFGIHPDEAVNLARAVAPLPGIQLRGLMIFLHSNEQDRLRYIK